jgi:hypothetical protein
MRSDKNIMVDAIEIFSTQRLASLLVQVFDFKGNEKIFNCRSTNSGIL